jgi:hypothetical protein
MTPFDVPAPLSPSTAADYVPPPPRPVAPNFRACCLRGGFLGGLVLGPLLVLWLGEVSSENLKMLAAQGRSTTGQVVVRG